MEREVGRGIGMGNTCKPMADSFQCMTKSTTSKKIIIIIIKRNLAFQMNSQLTPYDLPSFSEALSPLS